MSVSANANALITPTELETILNITISDSDYKQTLINIASDYIERYCDRKFIQQTYTREVYDGNGEPIMYLNNAPVTVSSVVVERWDTINNELDFAFTVNDDYLIYGAEGYIYKRSGWYRGRSIYRITYQAGWAQASIPYDLKLACAKIAAIVKNNAANPGVGSEAMGKYSVSYDLASLNANGINAYPPDIIGLLNQYERTLEYGL